jgi:hypothetical protein
MSCCVLCKGPDGQPYVLKLPLDPAGGALEAAALQHWTDSSAVPAVAKVDLESGAILMRYIDRSDVRPESVRPFVDMFSKLYGCGSFGVITRLVE